MSAEYDVDATVYGARLGKVYNEYFIGGEYGVGTYQLDRTSPQSTTTLDEQEATLMGAFAGIKSKDDINLWLTYYFKATMKYEGDKESDDGKGIGVGLSFAKYRPISINVEYRKITYSSTGFNGYETSDGDNEMKYTEIFIGLSYFFEFDSF